MMTKEMYDHHKQLAYGYATRGSEHYTEIAASVSIAQSNLVIIDLLEKILQTLSSTKEQP